MNTSKAEKKEMETKVCKVCGKELPISSFARTKIGLLHTCKECVRQNQIKAKLDKKLAKMKKDDVATARKLRLCDFEPNELMAELSRRGYEGKLSYTKTYTIDISNVD